MSATEFSLSPYLLDTSNGLKKGTQWVPSNPHLAIGRTHKAAGLCVSCCRRPATSRAAVATLHHTPHRRASPRCAVLLHQRPLLALTTNLCLDARPANEGGLRHGSRGCTERHRRLRRPHVLRLPSLRLLAAASTTCTRRRFDYTYSPPRFNYTYSPPLRLLSAASAALPAHRYCCRLLHRRCFAARRRLLLLRLLPSAVRALLLPLAAASRFAAARYFCCLLPSASHRRCFAARCRLPVLRSLPSAASLLLSCLPPSADSTPTAACCIAAASAANLLPPAGLPPLAASAACCRLLHIAAALLLAAGCRFCACCRLLLCCSPPSAASALAAVCAVWPLLVLLSAAPPLFCCSLPPAASALARCRLLYGCCRLLHRRCFAAHLPLPLLRSLPSADRRCLPPLSLLAAVCFTSPLLAAVCRFCARCRLPHRRC